MGILEREREEGRKCITKRIEYAKVGRSQNTWCGFFRGLSVGGSLYKVV